MSEDTSAERAERLRKVIALEIDRIVEDLEARREVLIELWGRTRDRGMFLDTVFSRWKTLGFPDLLDLETAEVAAVDAFYRELHELRFYFRFTEDMPVHMLDAYDLALHRLRGYGELALELLGGPPDRPYIEFPEDELPSAPDEDDLAADEEETPEGSTEDPNEEAP
ncbi:MAG: hypothetical protein EP330_28895 [Deltaproteobacteria bacterium]|nr:MAG: hypothetical protein EP330_28895 [Deltaproteobacteria bacterium]